jgi:hypothetical protein
MHAPNPPSQDGVIFTSRKDFWESYMLDYRLTRLVMKPGLDSFSVLVFRLKNVEKGANPYGDGERIRRMARGNSCGADFVFDEVGHVIDVVGHDSLDRSRGPLSCGS